MSSTQLSSSESDSDHETTSKSTEIRSKLAAYSTPRTTVCRPVTIAQPTGLSIDAALSKLNRYRDSFLDQVEAEVYSLIRNSRKRDCTAIVGIKPDGRRVVFRVMDDTWTRRLIAMVKSEGSTPTYKDDKLDSYLSQPIIEKVTSLHAQFLRSHGNILGSYAIYRLRNNSAVRRQFAREFASSVRQAGKPLSDELAKSLIHLIHLQLSSNIPSDLSQQLGNALTHVAGTTAIASFTSLTAHAFQGVVTKVLAKFAIATSLKSALTIMSKIVGKTVLTSVAAFLGSHLTAHGVGIAGALPVYLAVLPIAAIFTAHQIDEFPEKLAKKIAPDVRAVMSGEFRERNRSVLVEIGLDTLKDGGRMVCDALIKESGVKDRVVRAAEEMLKAEDNGFYTGMI